MRLRTRYHCPDLRRNAPMRNATGAVGVRDVARLKGIVLRREIEILGAGHQDRACPDRPERLPDVSAIKRAGADVAGLPSRKFSKQVVGVPVLCVVGFPVDNAETRREVLSCVDGSVYARLF